MNTKYKSYAGIGSREIPQDVMSYMNTAALKLAAAGYTLRSGGADGADSAFEMGCIQGGGQKEIFLPWKGFNSNKSSLYYISKEALDLAEDFHPRWDKLNQAAQKLMARNGYQVLGSKLDHRANFVICWTKDGKASGGTGQAIRIANHYNIQVYNLKNETDKEKLQEFLVSLF